MGINLNPFSSKFLKSKDSEEELEKEIIKNSQGISADELINAQYNKRATNSGNPNADFFAASYDIMPVIVNKRNKVFKYREMSTFPEISDALDIICDEALPEDKYGNMFQFSFKNEGDIPKNIKNTFKEEYDHIINTVFKPTKRSRAWQYLRRFLIDGELFAELVSDREGKGLIGLKLLSPISMYPVYTGVNISHFIQCTVFSDNGVDNKDSTRLESNQVAYINYIDYGHDLTEVKGYLETARRVYNHLKNLEDAIVIYNLVRAPERRLWNIDMGKLPPGQREAALANMVGKYRKNINYESDTGEINSNYNVQSIIEDYWFAKDADGKGTTVDVLQGGTAYSDMSALTYMQNKLYKVLKVPRTRWDKDQVGPYQAKKAGSIEREEIKFSNFIKRIQGIYREFILQVYFQHLRMKMPKELHQYINTQFLDIQFTLYNEFAENRRIEQVNDRLAVWSQLSQDVVNENNLNANFSEEFVLRDLVGFSEEEYAKHKRLRNRDRTTLAAAAAESVAQGQESALDNYQNEAVQTQQSQEPQA